MNTETEPMDKKIHPTLSWNSNNKKNPTMIVVSSFLIKNQNNKYNVSYFSELIFFSLVLFCFFLFYLELILPNNI